MLWAAPAAPACVHRPATPVHRSLILLPPAPSAVSDAVPTATLVSLFDGCNGTVEDSAFTGNAAPEGVLTSGE